MRCCINCEHYHEGFCKEQDKTVAPEESCDSVMVKIELAIPIEEVLTQTLAKTICGGASC